LRITGGYGGPATWLDLQLNLSSLSQEDSERLSNTLEKYLGKNGETKVAKVPNFPDGRVYDFEIDDDGNKRILSMHDGNIPPDIAELIPFIHKHSS
jgi:meiotically up-regulated gene 157 (Mug157) protein